MITTTPKVIDGIEFRTTQIPAMRAYPLFIRLVKVVGPALASLQGVSMDADVSSLGPLLGSAVGGLEPDEATRLMIDMFASTRAVIDTKIIDLNSEAGINKVFTGRLPTMFKVLGFVAQENFSGFFPGSVSEPDARPAADATLS